MMGSKSLLLAVFVSIAVLGEIEGHRLGCTSDQFRCFNGKCIKRSWFCDDANDCGDNSDERFCSINMHSTSCPVEEALWFLCSDRRRCIPTQWKCDGLTDCRDGSDESDCARRSYIRVRNRLTTESPVVFQELSTPGITSTEGNTINSIAGVPATINRLVENFRATRVSSRSLIKWGPQLPRTVVALFLTDPQLFAPGNVTGSEMVYELSLQTMAKLALKKKITTQELALYINAMTVSCINPKDFFGVDLVSELRNRVDNSNYSNPFTILTLCNAGDSMTPTDVIKVKSAFHLHRRPLWTDVQALAVMAMACLKSQVDSTVVDTTLTDMVSELKTKQHKNSTIDNMRTTAMVLQALISTNSYLVDFDFGGAVKYLVREVENGATIQDGYAILPALNSVSFVNITSKHCSFPVKTELEVLKNLQDSLEERITVRVSMFLGSDIDFVRTWQLKVPANYNFYQVLENIASFEPNYKVRYNTARDKKPYVVGMHNYFDDAEDEIFWFIYSQKAGNGTSPTLVEKSPVDIPVKEDEELILWYRSGVWVDSP